MTSQVSLGAQHGWPPDPHVQMFPAQVRLAPQLAPAQQGWPGPPHAQVPWEQAKAAVQVAPLQHGSPCLFPHSGTNAAMFGEPNPRCAKSLLGGSIAPDGCMAAKPAML